MDDILVAAFIKVKSLLHVLAGSPPYEKINTIKRIYIDAQNKVCSAEEDFKNAKYPLRVYELLYMDEIGADVEERTILVPALIKTKRLLYVFKFYKGYSLLAPYDCQDILIRSALSPYRKIDKSKRMYLDAMSKVCSSEEDCKKAEYPLRVYELF